jgi:hypothetical protein
MALEKSMQLPVKHGRGVHDGDVHKDSIRVTAWLSAQRS